jgi:NhaP-type Na+/H+ or K+/H+ antiporter
VVRNLLTAGLVITFVSGALLAGLLDVLPWRTAFMFGALVTVTGPTVIGPLVRATRLNDHVRAVLLGEGVLIDPLGAILAVVVLQFALSGFQGDPFLWVPSRLLGGAAFGLLGVAGVRAVLYIHRTPEANDMTLLLLGMSVATLALAERALPDSGLTAMATMGVVLAGMRLPHAEEVRSFEDELSRILLAAVYVLSAATLELELVLDLWPQGFLVVLGLMLLVRPLAVGVSSLGSDLLRRERIYIAAIAPRGVVAVALAAFAGEALGDELGGPELTALVFLTVVITIGVQSSYAAPLARLLEVRSMRARVAGAGTIARRVGAQLSAGGFDVVLVDPDGDAVAEARGEGMRAELGDASDLGLMEQLGAKEATLAVAATDSDETNLLFSQYVLAENPEASVFARVAQGGAVEAFRRSGIHTIDEHDAVADAMMTVIGQPVLHDALAPGGHDRLMLQFEVGTGLDGRRIRELRLPQRVLVLLVRHAEEDVIPDGETVLRRGNRMLLYGGAGVVREARAQLALIE